MEDLIVASATIHGAQIQASYALWSAVISSIIGALGVIYAAYIAFKTGLKQIKQNNLLEAKREVYLDFIAKYNSLVRSYELTKIHQENYYEMIYSRSFDFDIAIEKVLLLCE